MQQSLGIGWKFRHKLGVEFRRKRDMVNCEDGCQARKKGKMYVCHEHGTGVNPFPHPAGRLSHLNQICLLLVL